MTRPAVKHQTLLFFTGVLSMLTSPVVAVAQNTPAERGHGLTNAEAAAGWISLFDGTGTFGWKGARVENGRLVGGTTTTEFGDCELRGTFARGGMIRAGGKAVAVRAGQVTIESTGRRGAIG